MDLCISSNKKLISFAKTISGKYSNIEQSRNEPKRFAHINIYFRPIISKNLEFPAFYSEQSFDYDPWRPYRQAVLKPIVMKDILILENYSLKDCSRFAGAGFMPDLLASLTSENLIKRIGCSMHFREIYPLKYFGEVEPGCKCIINRGNHMTYLISKVEFDKHQWIGVDIGVDIKTKEKIWGSRNGDLIFKKTIDLSNLIKENWLH